MALFFMLVEDPTLGTFDILAVRISGKSFLNEGLE